MSYYQNRGYSQGGYSAPRSNYRSGYGGGYNRGYQQQQPPRKHSGSKITRMRSDDKSRDGLDCIVGWNKSKSRGFIKFVAVPCRDTKTKSQNPDTEKWVANVTFADGKKTFTAFYNVATKKLVIPDLEMVANPAKDYFGTFVKRRR